MESLPPRLAVAEEFAAKGGLPEPLPLYGHGASVSFEEEVRDLPAFRLVREAEAEDSIRLDPQAMELLAHAQLDLPAEGQAQSPRLRRRCGEHLLRLDEGHPFPAATADLEGHHHLGDRERVAEEETGEVAILRLRAERAGLQLALGGERLGAAPPKGIDEGLGAADIPVELCGRPVQVAVVEEELQTPERRLRAAICKRLEMRGAQEPVAVNGAKDVEVARRERHATYWCTLEAGQASLRVKHRLSVTAGEQPGKAAISAAKPLRDLRLPMAGHDRSRLCRMTVFSRRPAAGPETEIGSSAVRRFSGRSSGRLC